jgi:hypothetical protein
MSIVLRHKDEDGVEFFTLDSTGESGFLIARLLSDRLPILQTYDRRNHYRQGVHSLRP